MKTTKKDIEKAIKKQYNISNEHAQAIVEAFFATINELATQKNGVLVKNLGKFEFKEKIVERYTRNFKTQDGEIKRTLKEAIYFTPSKALRDL
jgi:nucleoid DNA-binding protein